MQRNHLYRLGEPAWDKNREEHHILYIQQFLSRLKFLMITQVWLLKGFSPLTAFLWLQYIYSTIMNVLTVVQRPSMITTFIGFISEFKNPSEFSDVNKIWSVAKGSSVLFAHVSSPSWPFLVIYNLWNWAEGMVMWHTSLATCPGYGFIPL